MNTIKKILFLILLVPVAHSEILELTCEVPMPIHVVYDFDSGEGYLDLPNDGLFIKKGREGKQKLADSLKEGINNTLVKVEGFGGVENVHFTSFVLQ